MRTPRLLRSTLIVLALALLAPVGASAATAPASQQVLKVNVGTLPTSLDPGRAAFESDLVVQNALFAPLYRSPGGSSGTITPFLAAGPPVVANGGLRYTVTLRAAKWSDGKPVTAADVKLAYARARRSYYGSFFSEVRSVTALGPRIVRFDLRTPVPWFGDLLASNVVAPVPSHTIRRHGADWLDLKNFVTSGPFRVASGRGRTELVLVPNDQWWGASSVKLKQVELLAVTMASATPLFRANRLDATLRDTSIHPSTLASWRGDPRLRTVPSGSAQYLFMNTASPALASPAVRRGIALAIDRAAIVAQTGQGIDRPLSTVVPDGIRGYRTVSSGTHLLDAAGTPDRARAAAELAAGGWVQGPTKLDLYYAAGVGYGAQVAQQVIADLFAVGVQVAARPVSEQDLAKVGVGISPVRAEVELVLQGWAADYADPQSFHQLFTCGAVTGGTNTSNFCSAEFDAAYAAATVFAPITQRAVGHRAAEDLLTGPTGLMPAVPLYMPMGDLLVQKWVRGFQQFPSGRVNFERISIDAH